jgi:hypothetical protein
MGTVYFVSGFRRRPLAHSQFAVAKSAVTHIRRASRRSRPVISIREIATPQMLSTGPKGTRKWSTFGCSLRSLIKEAHVKTSRQQSATPAQPETNKRFEEGEVRSPEVVDAAREKSGERGRNRTYNLLIKSQLLCQLSYAPETFLFS